MTNSQKKFDFNSIKNELKKKNFSFGKNWQKYLKTLNYVKVKLAQKSLKTFLGDINGKIFLDVGSGSGIFSYSIYHMGGKEIVSFDIDPFSVQCNKFLRNQVKNPEKWKIYQGSILDKKFINKIKSFGDFDIIYAWGVLHHTGHIWEAIKNTVSLLRVNSLLYVAIYNKTKTSGVWLLIKKIYNNSPNIGKLLVENLYFLIYYVISPLIKLKNPLDYKRKYKNKRGMDIRVDIKDWLGGYPYEYATFEEVIDFINELDPDLELLKYKKVNGKGNNEFLFKKKD